MRRALLGAAAFVGIGASGAVGFVALKEPAARSPSAEAIASTPERLARGRYLVEHVAICMDCHSEPRGDRFGIPHDASTHGAGGLCWTPAMGFAGTVCTENITPDAQTGLGAWTDGEILRGMREGVDREGAALFPLMPYPRFRYMSDEDAASVVAYLRTLPAIPRDTPERALDFPLSVIVNFEPAPLEGPVSEPDRSDRVAYGRYLVTMAGCEDCHSPVDEWHQPLDGRAFSGGQPFTFPWGGTVRSANITPDPATGIGAWSEAQFVGRIKAYADPAQHDVPVEPRKNTVMPWLPFSGMTEEDLGAIYAYLRTVPPITNTVERWPAG